MAFVEDFAPFLSESEFAVPCTLPGGAVVPVIFDRPHLDALQDTFESIQPTALGRGSDLATLSHGAEVALDSVAYSVVGVQPDGTGMTRLILELAP
jgi:hypothetical protein